MNILNSSYLIINENICDTTDDTQKFYLNTVN